MVRRLFIQPQRYSIKSGDECQEINIFPDEAKQAIQICRIRDLISEIKEYQE
jgi:hypothetical protein